MPKKILIIDDEEDMRIYLQTLLRKAGYQTEIAVNGEEALEKTKTIEPDLITLDILMPKKSGLNFFKSLRQDEQIGNIPIVIVSGISRHNEFFENETQKGRIVFIEKPIKPDSFLAIIEEMLKSHS